MLDPEMYEFIERKRLSYLLKYIELKYSKDFEKNLTSKIKDNFFNDRTTI
jgi:hypothetical protein